MAFRFDTREVQAPIFPRTKSSTVFADFAMYSVPGDEFQHAVIDMTFDTNNYVWFCGGSSKKVPFLVMYFSIDFLFIHIFFRTLNLLIV